MTTAAPQPPPQASTPAQAISPGGLLADAFLGPSWDRWRACLKAAFAEPMTAAELELFREVAVREPPTRKVRELWAIAGRWSGKDSVASAIATVAALGDYRRFLRPGEVPVILCLASDRDQARIVHGYIAGYFREHPLLKLLVARETDDGLELGNGVAIVVGTNNYRAVRGRTVVCAILDEAAFFRGEESAAPDVETYTALTPALARIPGSMLIGITTPYRRAGLVYERWQRHYGKNDDDVLVIRGATPLFNPNVDQRVIDADLARDPDKGAAEWLAEFRSDLSDFVDRAVVESCVISGLRELPPAGGISYSAFVDPSGGSSDSMTLAIGHRDRDNVAVLDCLREARAPFSPEAIVEEFAAVLRSYGIGSVRGDRYAGEWPAEQFSKRGISYESAGKSKGEYYLDFLPMLNSGRCQLLDLPRLVSQLCSLERRTARGGRDSIDHPPGAHDDVANAVAGVLVGLRVTESGWLEYYRVRREAAEQPRDRTPQTTVQQGMAGGRYADLLPKNASRDAEPVPASFPKPAQTKPGNALVTLQAPAPYAAFFASAPDGGSRKFTADADGVLRVPSSFQKTLERAGCKVHNDLQGA